MITLLSLLHSYYMYQLIDLQSSEPYLYYCQFDTQLSHVVGFVHNLVDLYTWDNGHQTSLLNDHPFVKCN